jgi:hypothetical protein
VLAPPLLLELALAPEPRAALVLAPAPARLAPLPLARVLAEAPPARLPLPLPPCCRVLAWRLPDWPPPYLLAVALFE